MNRTQRLSTEETPPATQAIPRSPEPRSLEMSLLRLLGNLCTSLQGASFLNKLNA